MKRVAIWGLGREGRAVFERRHDLFPDLETCVLIDESSDEIPAWAEGCSLEQPSILEEREFDLLVRSAGVSPYKPEIQHYLSKGGCVKSVSTLWFERNPGVNTLCITGTKGKSTTSKLVWHLLTKLGVDAALGGNIGVPLLELPAGKEWYVIEMSSYQTSDFEGEASVGAVLNLFEDHVSWHGGVDQYHRDKLRLLRQSRQALVGAGVKEHPAFLAEEPDLNREVLALEHQSQWRLEKGGLCLNGEVLDVSGLSLRGEHNLWNLRAAMSLVASCVPLEKLPQAVSGWRQLLEGYEPLPFRLEEVGVFNDKLWVCDPLSTNASSTIASLEAYSDKRVVLLMGGLNRDQDLSPLVEYIQKAHHVEAVIGMPDTGFLVLDALGEQKRATGLTLKQAASVEEGLTIAKQLVGVDVVLFSPASASLHSGETYITRGNAFKNGLF